MAAATRGVSPLDASIRTSPWGQFRVRLGLRVRVMLRVSLRVMRRRLGLGFNSGLRCSRSVWV